jgi:anti-repressor protein
MSNLQLFEFNTQSVRVISVNDEPWFVAQDVCKILDLDNVSKALSRLDDEEVTNLDRESILTLSNDPNVARLSAISESGLYSLTLGSRKPQAKDFKRWVTREVLPTIRKTGKYEAFPQVTNAIAPTLPQNFIEALKGLIKSEEEKLVLAEANQKLLEEKQVLSLAIAEVKPKAEFYDIYVSRDGWLTGEQIAKQLSVSTRKMFDVLRNEKVVFYRSGRNLPCARWVERGWATMRPVRCHDEVMRNNLVFSHKVIMQIFDLLQDNGLIEKNRKYNIHLESDEPEQMKRA